MAVINKLFEYWKNYELEIGRAVPISEIVKGTGLHRETVVNLIEKKTSRYDEPVIEKICEFFNVPPGPVPFMVYQPEGKFFKWLKTQTERDDPIGDFAGDSIRKSKEPRNSLPVEVDDLQSWQEYLVDFLILDPVVLDAFYDAWEEWSGETVVRSYSSEYEEDETNRQD